MRYTITFTLLMFLSCSAYCQIKAVTDSGEEVLLSNDGTWKYASLTPSYDTRIDTVNRTKSDKSTFLLKGDKVKYGVWLDPKKWSFKKSTGDEVYEYLITLKGEDAYLMIVPERIQIPINKLQEIVLNNFKKKGTDAHVVSEDTRKINGNIIKMVQTDVMMSGAKFSYLSYYFSYENGTIQLTAFTSQNLLSKYRKDMEQLLDGFVLLD